MQISDTVGGKPTDKVTCETVSSIETRLHDRKEGGRIEQGGRQGFPVSETGWKQLENFRFALFPEFRL